MHVDQTQVAERALPFGQAGWDDPDGYGGTSRRRQAGLGGAERIDVRRVEIARNGGDILRWYQVGHRAAKADGLDLGLTLVQGGDEGAHNTRNQHQCPHWYFFDDVDEQVWLESVDHVHRAAAQQRRD